MNTIVTDRPYPGLRSFRADEFDIFFGREEHTDQLLEKLGETRFIAVVGLSGCGKSSLVRAGMLAALQSGYLAEAGTQWSVVLMRPGQQPCTNLAQALLAQDVLGADLTQCFHQETPPDGNLLPVIADILRSEAFSLTELVQRTALPKENTNLLIVVDQFEEIFRVPQNNMDDTESDAFVKLLLTSAHQQDMPMYIVLTMRSDFIGHCARFSNLPEVLNRGQFLVPRLTPNQQRMAIEGPAGVFGGTIQSELVELLLKEMGNDPDQLPVLQHCLMRMWFLAKKRIGVQNVACHIITADYEAAGGLANALSNHAEEAFADLTAKQQHIAEIMFRCLTEGDRRRPVTLNEVAKVARVSTAEIEDVTKVFRRADRCFLRPYGDEPLQTDSILDISHESLIRQWKRLNNWVEQEAESAETYHYLEHTARLWKEEKAALWSTPDLDIGLKWKEKEKPTIEWAKRYGSYFDLSMKFLNTSLQAQEEKRLEEEREHRKRWYLRLVSACLILAVILATWAFWERGKAKKSTKKS